MSAVRGITLRINMISKLMNGLKATRKIHHTNDAEKREERIAQAAVYLGYGAATLEMMGEDDRNVVHRLGKEIQDQCHGRGDGALASRASDLLVV